ncbi:MAG: amidohydrolase family protein [Bacillota bacterium]|nr:amidohydrolase family protein [Bacillota bacterium]
MKYAIINALVLSGHEDMRAEKKALLIENGRIAAIADDAGKFGRVKTVDIGGKYLMPGLINLHVHLPGSGMPNYTKKQNAKTVRLLMGNPVTRTAVFFLCYKFARTQLMSGVTTIRTVGGLGNVDSRIRDSVNRGRLLGPRVLASNMAVSVPNGHMAGVLAYEAKTPEDCVRLVDKIAESKPDLIKIMITGGVLDAKKRGEPGELKMPPELVKACCDEAHRLGFKVAAHVESPAGLKAALENGVDTVEHGAFTDEAMAELFKARNAAEICTISPAIPTALFELEVSHSTELVKYNSGVVLEGVIDCAKKGLEKGYPVGLGTDTACPFVTHYDMWRELCYFKKYLGVSNAFALHTATEVNAEIAGISRETGTVETGKSADFLITEDNPLEDLQALRTPAMVVIRGKVIKKPSVKKFEYVEKELDKYM